MVPLEESMYLTQNGGGFGLGMSEYVYELNYGSVDEQKNESGSTHKEFTDYLEKMKSTLSQEEFRKLLVWAYQGCDLRYQRNCGHVDTEKST